MKTTEHAKLGLNVRSRHPQIRHDHRRPTCPAWNPRRRYARSVQQGHCQQHSPKSRIGPALGSAKRSVTKDKPSQNLNCCTIFIPCFRTVFNSWPWAPRTHKVCLSSQWPSFYTPENDASSDREFQLKGCANELRR